MATTAAPYGLRPVKRVDGMPYAGAFSTFLIDPAGVNTNIFYGSVVYINANGYIAIVTGTGADATTADTEQITAWAASHRPDLAVEVHFGGQPLYPYLFGVE